MFLAVIEREERPLHLHWLNVLGIALGLSMDAFAVSLAAAVTLTRITPRHVFRLSFHFGLFQFFMPLIGWSIGQGVASWIGALDHWLAFGLLAYVGGKMLWEAWHAAADAERMDPTRGWQLVTLSVATSLDALAVGLSLALIGVSVWMPSVVIGLVTATLTALGIGFGSRIGQRWGRSAEIAGGCVLLLIGLKILILAP
jgi:putative Mn2+ efflux pump MntP